MDLRSLHRTYSPSRHATAASRLMRSVSANSLRMVAHVLRALINGCVLLVISGGEQRREKFARAPSDQPGGVRHAGAPQKGGIGPQVSAWQVLKAEKHVTQRSKKLRHGHHAGGSWPMGEGSSIRSLVLCVFGNRSEENAIGIRLTR